MRKTILLAALALTGCDQVQPPSTTEGQPTKQSTTQAAKKYGRDELKKLLVGKTADEVIQLIGRPMKTTGDATSGTWYYKSLTTDEVTGKEDYETYIHFTDAKVRNVTG